MSDPTRTAFVNAVPLVRALEVISELGRMRKTSGTDDEAVQYARIANAALLWRQADEAGDLADAQRYLDQLEAIAAELQPHA